MSRADRSTCSTATFYANGSHTTPMPGCATNAPVYWDEQNELWGISRYDDIVEVEKRKDDLRQLRQGEGRLPAQHPRRRVDHRPRRPQAHHAVRLLVSRRFTPRAVAEWEPHIRGAVRRHARRCARPWRPGRRSSDRAVPLPLPAMMIGHLLGFPDELWPSPAGAGANAPSRSAAGPRYHDEDGINCGLRVHGRLHGALRGEEGGARRRRHVGMDRGRARPGFATARTSGSTRSSATACCCSTVAPRPPVP